LVYEIAGPLFFGAAQKAMGALSSASAKDKTVILDIESVPTIDLTGLVALESALDRLWKSDAFVVISGVGEQPASVLEKAGFAGQGGKLAICKDYADAVDIAW